MTTSTPPRVVSVLAASRYLSELHTTGLDHLKAFPIAILANYTLRPVELFINYHFARSGLWPKLYFGLTGAALQESSNADSLLYKSNPRIILVSNHLEANMRDWGTRDWRAETISEPIEKTLEFLLANSTAHVLVSTFLEPSELLISDVLNNNVVTDQIQRLNGMIREFVAKHPNRMALIDFNLILRNLGAQNAIDHRFWYLSKSPLRPAFLNLLSFRILSYANLLSGNLKKCLVLDCDNTLWGGIIGEIGLGGIRLDPNDYPGSVYYKIQEQLLTIQASGIMLALCSKNNEQDVWEVIDTHPHCLLKRHHLVTAKINWNNKPDNIRNIATELNLTLESLVFLDDSPYECGLVNQIYPQIMTLTVPRNIWEYPDLLTSSTVFSARPITIEDRVRTQQYQTESLRQVARIQSSSIEQYLRNLEIIVNVAKMRTEDITRVAQLTQKTNQFNLTTLRYSEADIAAIHKDPSVFIYTLRAKDKFGDMGLTNVFIGRLIAADTIIIDTFLMSCRIFERRIEYAFLQSCVTMLASEKGITSFVASYRKSAKNDIVREFWPNCGYKEIQRTADEVVYQSDSSHLTSLVIDHIKVQMIAITGVMQTDEYR